MPKQNLLASVIRIIATILIFIFHYLEVEGIKNSYNIDKIGIFLFVLISGFFAYNSTVYSNPLKWLIKRIKTIIIPYWIVIIIVLIANYVVEYKQTTFLKNTIIFFGGSLFVEDPLYVVSWFITYIMLLYLCVYIYNIITIVHYKYIFILISLFAFYYYNISNPVYFIGFFIGFFYNKYAKHEISNFIVCFFKLDKVNHYLRIVQNHCYSFFLLHGGVLHLVNFFDLFSGYIFIISFVFTLILSIIHNYISFILINYEYKSTKNCKLIVRY